MEAAMEQACSAVDAPSPAPSLPALSLQQSRQVLQVLQEAFSAVVFYLQQVKSKPLPLNALLPLWLLSDSSPFIVFVRWMPVAMATPLSSPPSAHCAPGWPRRLPV